MRKQSCLVADTAIFQTPWGPTFPSPWSSIFWRGEGTQCEKEYLPDGYQCPLVSWPARAGDFWITNCHHFFAILRLKIHKSLLGYPIPQIWDSTKWIQMGQGWLDPILNQRVLGVLYQLFSFQEVLSWYHDCRFARRSRVWTKGSHHIFHGVRHHLYFQNQFKRHFWRSDSNTNTWSVPGPLVEMDPWMAYMGITNTYQCGKRKPWLP